MVGTNSPDWWCDASPILDIVHQVVRKLVGITWLAGPIDESVGLDRETTHASGDGQSSIWHFERELEFDLGAHTCCSSCQDKAPIRLEIVTK